MKRGTTLIELVIVIGLISTILSLGGVVMHGLMRQHQHWHDSAVARLAVSRFSTSLRDAVHAAREVQASNGQNVRVVLPGDREIEFVSLPGMVREIRRTKGAIVSREEYRLGETTSIEFVAPPQPENDTLQVHLLSQSPASNDFVAWGRIDVVIGLDRRFQVVEDQDGQP